MVRYLSASEITVTAGLPEGSPRVTSSRGRGGDHPGQKYDQMRNDLFLYIVRSGPSHSPSHLPFSSIG